MGEAKLDGSSGSETQTARLSSVEKEDGCCTTREMGEVQSEKSSLELKGVTASVISSGCSDAGCVTAVGYFDTNLTHSPQFQSNIRFFVPETEQECLAVRPMTRQIEACCSSPAAICYWFVASLMAWGALSLIGIYWHPLHASEATCLFAMAIGCLANWLRNRSFHCAITGPLFLIGGIVFLLSGVRVIHVNTSWVWLFVLIGTGIAFVLDWRYAKRSAS